MRGIAKGSSGSMKKQKFEGGATRSATNVRMELIPAAALRGLGRRLALGATRHGENNWREGGEEFRKATIGHLLAHIADYLEAGNTREANTDAIICNAAFLCHFEERTPFSGSAAVPVVSGPTAKVVSARKGAKR